MGQTLSTALAISGIGIVVLLLVLTALAGIIYLMTRYLVDKEEKEEVTEQAAAPAVAVEAEETGADLKLVAAVAVAIARAQADTVTVSAETSAGEVNSWRQFGLQRRLNQSSTIRRTR